ncbi:MAG: GH1 family beta-glucosidase [Vulcanimicrobiota bacterium]
MQLPEDFLLGVATSSFQIEGALDQDGRGPSIWDVFELANGDTGEKACDHYHLYREDVKLIKGLGASAYRFSIAWPRVVPDGEGKVNPKGLDFYSRLVDELLEQEIEPWATLYHWDLPLALHEKGGWKSRETALRFAEYTNHILDALGDRVKHWFTLNEPWCTAILGYQTGEHAPGERADTATVLKIIHNLLLAHGYSLQQIREAGDDHLAGIVLNPWIPLPLTESREDREAAERAWQEQVGWWFEPLFEGHYPSNVKMIRQSEMPEILDGDLELISAETDFMGLNLYFPGFVRHAPEAAPFYYEECGSLVNLPRTEMGWHVYPPVLSYALAQISKRYKPKAIYVTENGCATPDLLDDRGGINDLFRKEYLRTHMLEALRSREQEGVPLKGYFVWSLMDNYEWQYGYSKRFGLVHVDYDTLERTPKTSARWFAGLARKRRVDPWLHMETAAGPLVRRKQSG